MLKESGCRTAPWLVAHGLRYDTDLHQDLNGDGVPIALAY